jgi:hypothetical protein
LWWLPSPDIFPLGELRELIRWWRCGRVDDNRIFCLELAAASKATLACIDKRGSPKDTKVRRDCLRRLRSSEVCGKAAEHLSAILVDFLSGRCRAVLRQHAVARLGRIALTTVGHTIGASDCHLFHDEVAIQSLLAADTIEPLNLDRFTQCALVGDVKVRVIHEEDQVIATWMGAIHLDIIVKLL